MSNKLLYDLMAQADKLEPDQQLQLIAHLAQRVRHCEITPKPRRKWKEIAGAAPYPMLGEDAQVWVTRTRRGGDVQLKDEPGVEK